MSLNSIIPSFATQTAASGLEALSSASATACTGLHSNSVQANLSNELRAGVSDDANSIGMLSQLASTLGNLNMNSQNGASTINPLSIPSTESTPQAFRSYSSMQSPQGASSADTMMASLIDDQASGDASTSIG